MNDIKAFMNSRLYKAWSKKFPDRAANFEKTINVKPNKNN